MLAMHSSGCIALLSWGKKERRCYLLGNGVVQPQTKLGGDGGTRTLDPLNAIEVLSQLSYIPTKANYSKGGFLTQGSPLTSDGITAILKPIVRVIASPAYALALFGLALRMNGGA